MRALTVLALSLAVAGCSSGYKSESLGVELKPPPGFSVDEETPNSVSFTGGLEIVSTDWKAPGLDEGPLENLAEAALENSKRTMPGKILSSRKGDLGGVKTARFEYKSDSERGLLYVLPRADRTVVIRFVSSGSSYGQKETQVERALGTLELQK